MKMTAAEYLRARGWICLRNGQEWCLGDWPISPEGDPVGVSITGAVAVQRAADAAEERKVWSDAFNAALGPQIGETKPDEEDAARWATRYADAALDAYRARFAVEVIDD